MSFPWWRVAFSSILLATLPAGADPVREGMYRHLEAHPRGDVPVSLDRSQFEERDLSSLPIGVFDSGIGGLTVLEALLTVDLFDNENFRPGADGRPDLQNERFIYLGDQANMPYGNYSAAGKADYLRELILRDAVFLLGNRYRTATGELRADKPPVKAIVIACNTATAYGLEDVRHLVEKWQIPIVVVGVVEAGARGLLSHSEGGAIGVLATVGTCASEVYPRTIQQTLGRAGRGVATITQFGSANLAGVIEGDPSFTVSLERQIEQDVRALIENHRTDSADPPVPLRLIMLGCTHFPLAGAEIDDAFTALRSDPELAPFIAAEREYINPAEWTARQLFQELASARLRNTTGETLPDDRFFLSIANASCPEVRMTGGSLDHDYKYGRELGRFDVEDTIIVPMTRESLPGSSRTLVESKLPAVWERLP